MQNLDLLNFPNIEQTVEIYSNALFAGMLNLCKIKQAYGNLDFIKYIKWKKILLYHL